MTPKLATNYHTRKVPGPVSPQPFVPTNNAHHLAATGVCAPFSGVTTTAAAAAAVVVAAADSTTASANTAAAPLRHPSDTCQDKVGLGKVV